MLTAKSAQNCAVSFQNMVFTLRGKSTQLRQFMPDDLFSIVAWTTPCAYIFKALRLPCSLTVPFLHLHLSHPESMLTLPSKALPIAPSQGPQTSCSVFKLVIVTRKQIVVLRSVFLQFGNSYLSNQGQESSLNFSYSEPGRALPQRK